MTNVSPTPSLFNALTIFADKSKFVPQEQFLEMKKQKEARDLARKTKHNRKLMEQENRRARSEHNFYIDDNNNKTPHITPKLDTQEINAFEIPEHVETKKEDISTQTPKRDISNNSPKQDFKEENTQQTPKQQTPRSPKKNNEIYEDKENKEQDIDDVPPISKHFAETNRFQDKIEQEYAEALYNDELMKRFKEQNGNKESKDQPDVIKHVSVDSWRERTKQQKQSNFKKTVSGLKTFCWGFEMLNYAFFKEKLLKLTNLSSGIDDAIKDGKFLTALYATSTHPFVVEFLNNPFADMILSFGSHVASTHKKNIKKVDENNKGGYRRTKPAHNSEEPIIEPQDVKCDICSFVCQSIYDFKDHMKTHVSNNTSQKDELMPLLQQLIALQLQQSQFNQTLQQSLLTIKHDAFNNVTNNQTNTQANMMNQNIQTNNQINNPVNQNSQTNIVNQSNPMNEKKSEEFKTNMMPFAIGQKSPEWNTEKNRPALSRISSNPNVQAIKNGIQKVLPLVNNVSDYIESSKTIPLPSE